MPVLRSVEPKVVLWARAGTVLMANNAASIRAVRRRGFMLRATARLRPVNRSEVVTFFIGVFQLFRFSRKLCFRSLRVKF